MSDLFNTGYTNLHLVNLGLHVGAGSIAIGLGLFQYFTKKGSQKHKMIGKLYSALFLIVLFTAIFGTLLFGYRPFLASLTLSATYAFISAIRVVKIRECGPVFLDNSLSIVFCTLALGFILLNRLHVQELALVTQIALANVIALGAYDLARNIGGKAWLEKSWLNEHIYKMIGTHSALISAGAGNVFREAQPWSILAPVILCSILTIVFMVRNPLSSNSHALS